MTYVVGKDGSVEIGDREKNINGEWAGKPLPLIYLDCTGMEPTDLIGLPSAGGEYTEYKSPEFLKPLEKEPCGVLILDEVTRLDLQVRHTVMQMLSRREIGRIKMNPGWLIVMTANPADAEYQVAELDVAYRRRATVIPVSFNLDVWREWAIYAGVHPRIIGASGRVAGSGLNKAIDKEIKQTLTPAGMRAAGDLVRAGVTEVLDASTAFEILSGTVGDVAAKAFMESVNDEKLQKYLDIAMAGGKGLKDLPHDQAIALVCMFWEKIHKQTKKFAPQIKNLYDQLNMDIRMMLIKMCYDDMIKYPDDFSQLINDWSEWCTKQVQDQQARQKKLKEKRSQ